mmetsp:Transcript_4729/g.6846  ORF Transcript_4729/g.6846 Transcript_4729/m.6846 type:complete len:111 (-) Transcript_4729:518-850(-)
MIEAVRTDLTQSNMYYSKDESGPFIDMIFRFNGGFVAIQSTSAITYSAKSDHIRELKDGLDLANTETLRIFYGVPASRFQQFETKPINPLLDQPDLNNVFIYFVDALADE